MNTRRSFGPCPCFTAPPRGLKLPRTTVTTTTGREKPLKMIQVFVLLPWANISAMQKVRTLRRWDALLYKDEYAWWRVTDFPEGWQQQQLRSVSVGQSPVFYHDENPFRQPCRSIWTRRELFCSQGFLQIFLKTVFTGGTRLRMSLALRCGCSPRLCRLTGPLLYKQLRMLNWETLSLSAAARAQIKVVGPGGGWDRETSLKFKESSGLSARSCTALFVPGLFSKILFLAGKQKR